MLVQESVNPRHYLQKMMLRHMLGWKVDYINESMDRTIMQKVTYDFHRMMDNAEKVTSSGFADEMIKRM